MQKPLLVLSLAVVLTASTFAFSFNTSTIATGLRPDMVAVADFNGDNIADCAVTTDTPDKIELRFGTGNGNFGTAQNIQLPISSSPAGLKAADVDGDGDQDMIVVLKDNNQIRIVTNSGGGSFALGASFPTGLEPVDLARGDVNNDGRPDFATANRGANSVTVFTNTGGSFSTLTVPTGAEPRSVALGDLDGDLDADIAFTNHDDRTISTWRSNGGSFALIGTFSVGNNNRGEGIAIANVDSDGDNDVLVASNGNGLNWVQVFANEGHGTLSSPASFNSGGVDPSYLSAADFDGDGDVDVAVANQTSNNVGVLVNNGAGGFGAAATYPTGTTPERLIVADMNNDGSPDIAAPNRDSNTITVLFNTMVASVKVSPSTLTFVRGRQISGDVTSLSVSDDQDLVGELFFVANQQEAPVQIQFDGTVGLGNVTSITFTLEGAVNTPNLVQTLMLWDWNSSQWVTIDTRGATLTDSTASVNVSADAARFVSSAGSLRARVAYRANGPTASTLWRTATDFVQWTINR